MPPRVLRLLDLTYADRNETYVTELSDLGIRAGEQTPRMLEFLDHDGTKIVFGYVRTDFYEGEVTGYRYQEMNGLRKLLVIND